MKNINAYRFVKIVFMPIFVTFWATITILFSINVVQRKFIYPLEYKDIVLEYSFSYGLDPSFIFAVIKEESGFDKNAKSGKGAMGLMQITPKTGEYIAKMMKIESYDLLDERTNVNFGCFYLKYLFQKFNYLETVVCAYNAGEGKVLLWLNDSKYSEDKIKLKSIPYYETEQYLRKIMKSYKKYIELYGNSLDKLKNIE